MSPTTLRRLVADAGDVVERAVGILDVAHHDPLFRPERVEGALVADVVALEMVDGDPQDLTDRRLVGEDRRHGLHPEVDRPAEELEARVLLQRAREQTRLGEHLEAVADPDDRSAGACVLGHRFHDRREACDRAGVQVVAVGEAAGYDDGVDPAHRGVGVEEQLGLGPERLDRVEHIELAVRAGELDDADLHRGVPFSHGIATLLSRIARESVHADSREISKASMTGLASSR